MDYCAGQDPISRHQAATGRKQQIFLRHTQRVVQHPTNILHFLVIETKATHQYVRRNGRLESRNDQFFRDPGVRIGEKMNNRRGLGVSAEPQELGNLRG